MRTAGIVLFKHTIRLHKRFGSNTNFENGNIKDAVERARNYFGKGACQEPFQLRLFLVVVESGLLPNE